VKKISFAVVIFSLAFLFSLLRLHALPVAESQNALTKKINPLAESKLAQKNAVTARPDDPAISNFHALITETFEGLPKLRDLKRRRHSDQMPPEILRASQGLSEIHDAVASNPRLAPYSFEFYRACAQSNDLVIPVRAVCLRDLSYWTARLSIQDQPRATDYPQDVWNLSKTLPLPF
jgi:hypothetical protein